MESGFNVTSNSNPSISNPININTSEKESKSIEPLIVGNANVIIRFLCLFAVILTVLSATVFFQLGKQAEKISLLEDIVINGIYGVTSDASRK